VKTSECNDSFLVGSLSLGELTGPADGLTFYDYALKGCSLRK